MEMPIMDTMENAEMHRISSVNWSASQILSLLAVLLMTVFLCIRAKLTKQKQISPIEGIPVAPGAHWFYGHLKYMTGGIVRLSQLFTNYANEDGVTAFWTLTPMISLLDARDARAVLRQGSYKQKWKLARKHILKTLGEESLIFSEGGKSWTNQRRVIQYAFTAMALVDYRPPVFEVLKNIVASLKKSCIGGKSVEINISFLSSLFTMQVFGEVALGHNFRCISDCDDYSNLRESTKNHDAQETPPNNEGLKQVKKSAEFEAFKCLLEDMILRVTPGAIFNPGLQFYWIPTQRNREYKKQTQVIHNLLLGIIQRQRNRLATERKQFSVEPKSSSEDSPKKNRVNMLSHIIREREDASDKDLIEVLKTLLVAGYETTSVSIAFALYNLSKNPRCQERCSEEARRIFDKYGTDQKGVIDECEFKYIHASIKESMRLSPTVLFSGRLSTKPIKIGKTTIQTGTAIILPFVSILVDERNFERPKEFCPERWVSWNGQEWVEREPPKEANDQSNDNGNKDHSSFSHGPKSSNPSYQEQNEYSETISPGDINNFLAFSHGVRDCVGKRLARLETTIFLAFIMKDFIVEYDDTQPPPKMTRRMASCCPQHLPIIFRQR